MSASVMKDSAAAHQVRVQTRSAAAALHNALCVVSEPGWGIGTNKVCCVKDETEVVRWRSHASTGCHVRQSARPLTCKQPRRLQLQLRLIRAVSS